MTTNFEKLQKEIRALSSREKAALAHALIDDLDPNIDDKSEELWIEEARRRYEAYQAGNMKVVPGEGAMQRARDRLK